LALFIAPATVPAKRETFSPGASAGAFLGNDSDFSAKLFTENTNRFSPSPELSGTILSRTVVITAAFDLAFDLKKDSKSHGRWLVRRSGSTLES
jgi:hypothetical protein